MRIAKLKMPLGIILAVAALLAINVVPVMAGVPVNSPFSGDVIIDAAAAPDGSEVAAYVADETDPRGTATTSGGAYELVLFGDATDVGKAVSFKVKKAGTEVWLAATTDPESPTFANYDPQVVNLFAFTVAAPTAEFSASPTSGTAALTVNFTDESTGDITSWSWSFGDGGTSDEQNPSHSYSDAGTYDVSLGVSGAAGSDTETKLDYITVSAAPPPGGVGGTPYPPDKFGILAPWIAIAAAIIAGAAIFIRRRRLQTPL